MWLWLCVAALVTWCGRGGGAVGTFCPRCDVTVRNVTARDGTASDVTSRQRCEERPAAAHDVDQCLYALTTTLPNGTEHEAIVEILSTEWYFKLSCPAGVALDDVALPRFGGGGGAARSVDNATLVGCAPPRSGLGAALGRLAVTPRTRLALLAIPAAAELSAARLAGLPPLRALLLTKAAGNETPLLAANDVFTALPDSLRVLKLVNVVLPAAALATLPAQLEELELQNAALRCADRDGCAALLSRLPQLSTLRVYDAAMTSPLALWSAPALRRATVVAPLDHGPLLSPRVHSLENATFWNVHNVSLGGCGSVRHLSVVGARVTSLPADWLRGCGELRSLSLRWLGRLRAVPPTALVGGAARLREWSLRESRALRRLPPRLLADHYQLEVVDLSRNALEDLPHDLFGEPDAKREKALRVLLLRGNRLSSLPSGWLAATPRLLRLDLAQNRLLALQSGLFEGAGRLEALDVSHNLLGGGDVTVDVSLTLAGLAALRRLRSVSLAHNALGDLCPLPNVTRTPTPRSVLGVWELRALEELDVSGVGAERLCPDWRRHLPALRRVAAADNRVTSLAADDLSWPPRRAPLTLDLSRNPLRRVVLAPHEFDTLVAPTQPPNVTILIDAALQCDCTMYWLARARRDGRLAARLPRLRCAPPGPEMLDDRDLTLMECEVSAAQGCPTGCACAWRAHTNESRVRCRGAALTRPPPLHRATATAALDAARLTLDLADNNLTALPDIDKLPDILYSLDLRNNSISGAEWNFSSSLLALTSRADVWLAGNPWRCACGPSPSPWLAPPPSRVRDAPSLRCAGDGRSVFAAAAACQKQGRGTLWSLWLAAGVCVMLAATAAAAVRRRVVDALLRRGLCVRWLAAHDPDYACKYDAFVSFAHADTAAAEEIVTALESGSKPLRLCLHQRDWRVGGWIPDQIAESVAQSRRTIVLLSEHYVSSGWARAEFREATAHALRQPTATRAPRVVVVLLGYEPPAMVARDPELRRYVLHNTYLRRDDPAFWRKLRVTLAPTAVAAASKRRRLRPKALQAVRNILAHHQPSPKVAAKTPAPPAPSPRRKSPWTKPPAAPIASNQWKPKPIPAITAAVSPN